MVFHLNSCKNVFRPLFCHFLPNSAILRPPIFSGHGQFFVASFELFGRKFGHLATVDLISTKLFRYLYTVLPTSGKSFGQLNRKIRPLAKKFRSFTLTFHRGGITKFNK
jgi:hypothetical protein